MSDSSLKIARRCGVEIKGALRLLCSNKYTSKLEAKSQDNRIKSGDFFGIYFLDKQPSTYVVLFHNRATKHCRALWPTNGTEFQCFDGIDKNSTLVSLGKTDFVTCIPHRSTYTDDLLEACGVKSSSPQPMITVMHYRAVEATQSVDISSASGQFQWEGLLIIFILSMLVCLFYRLRQ